MDQTTLVRMLRLRTLAARKGAPFDVERFAADRGHAKATLKTLLQIDDDELQAACRQMMETLRLTTPSRRGGAPSTVSGSLDAPAGASPAADASRELVDSEWP
ncbi:MAG TPA: hypothetical protein VFR90_12225 [Methylibium sp.]|uniref:hypothetical protein n=1 Tax=Methylibium sp. TaxID=2067992 RepID=UPI002DB8C5BE|nr:hypothetical protein [Methylibium sp.]HEU4459882.1 hypothetical protein [Methylibium sp.]